MPLVLVALGAGRITAASDYASRRVVINQVGAAGQQIDRVSRGRQVPPATELGPGRVRDMMGRSDVGRVRRLLTVAASALAVVAAACTDPTPSGSGACVAPESTPIVDEVNGFSICLPGHWRELLPGDPGWVEIYDEPNGAVEQEVAIGQITHFAVPLRPRDVDLVVNLTIYVRPNDTSRSTADAGAAYLEVARRGGGTELAVSMVDLPAGEAAEVTGFYPNDVSDIPSTDWIDAFVITTADLSYYVLFSCDRESKGTYEDAFQRYASTFTLLPRPSRSPS